MRIVVVVQLLSRVQLFATLWTAACQASLPITLSLSFLKLISIESVMPSNHLILCHTILLLPSISPASGSFQALSSWPKYWSFSISPSSEYSGLISFRIDWFDLLAAQETLKRLLQHHSLKVRIGLNVRSHYYDDTSCMYKDYYFRASLTTAR